VEEKTSEDALPVVLVEAWSTSLVDTSGSLGRDVL
jgi:hypothetical protein